MSNTINKKKVINNISWSIAEKMLTELVNTLITIILARLLIPDDYGTVALVIIFINISSIFVTCGLGPALIQNKNADEIQVSTAFYLNLFIGIILYFVLFFVSPYISKFYDRDELTLVLRVLAIKIPINAVYDIQHAYIKKRLEFKKFFFSSLFGTIIGGVVGIVLAKNGYGVWALVFSTLIDQIMDSIILFFSTRWFPSFRFSIKSSKKMISFAQKLFITDFIAKTYNQIRSLLIGKKFTVSDLAYNSKGQKITTSISELIISSVVRVMSPVLSIYQDERIKMREIVRECIRVSSFFVIPAMAGIISTASVFIPLILTDKWVGCVPYIQIYCLIMLIGSSSYMDRYVVEACGKGNVLIKIQFLQVVLELSAVCLGILFFNNPIYLALTGLVTQAIYIVVTNIECYKLIEYGLLSHLKDMIKPITISFVMGTIVFLIKYIGLSLIVTLIIQIITGIVLYTVLSLCFNYELTNKFIKQLKTSLERRKEND